MRKLPVVRDYMDKYVHSLRPDMDVLEAVEFLVEHRVTGAPVLAANGDLIGILTEKDCLKLVSMGGAGGAFPTGKVSDYMTTTVKSIPSNMDIYYAAGMFLTVDFRRFLVVDDGRLVGGITRFDILRAIQMNLAEHLQQE